MSFASSYISKSLGHNLDEIGQTFDRLESVPNTGQRRYFIPVQITIPFNLHFAECLLLLTKKAGGAQEPVQTGRQFKCQHKHTHHPTFCQAILLQDIVVSIRTWWNQSALGKSLHMSQLLLPRWQWRNHCL